MAPAANHLAADLLCKLDQLGRAVAAVMPLEPALAVGTGRRRTGQGHRRVWEQDSCFTGRERANKAGTFFGGVKKDGGVSGIGDG